jgi:hypothetical protein
MELICNTCKLPKPEEAFSKDKRSKTGRQHKCKACYKQWKTDHKEQVAETAAQHYQENKDAIIKRVTAYNKANPEKKAIWHNKWQEKQPKKIKKPRKEKVEKPKKEPWDGSCQKCGIIKPPEQFTVSNRTKEGITHLCKACDNIRTAHYREKQGPLIAQNHKVWRDGHPDNVRKSQKTYLEKHPGLKNSWTQNYRARKRGAFVEDVDQAIVYKRDKGICQICLKRVPKTAKFPDPLSPSYDHIIPLAKGGEHSYRNVVLTHLLCNTSKGDRGAQQQQRLF